MKREKVNCYECEGYNSIPHDIGLTDYCLIKGKFIREVIRYCNKFKRIEGKLEEDGKTRYIE